jgi:hypothetical protein
MEITTSAPAIGWLVANVLPALRAIKKTALLAGG